MLYAIDRNDVMSNIHQNFSFKNSLTNIILVAILDSCSACPSLVPLKPGVINDFEFYRLVNEL